MEARKDTILKIVMAVSFLTPFMGSALTTSIADIGIELSMGVNAAGSVISAYVLSTGAFLLPVSRMADSFGYLKTLFTGAALFFITTTLCGFAINGHMLITMRVIEGFAASMIFCSGMTLVSMYFPPNERGRAMGMVTFMVYSGLSLGPIVGGYLNDKFGWRSIFWFGMAITATVLVFFITRRIPFEKRKKVVFDVYGMVLFFTATSLFFAGFSIHSHAGIAMVAVGIILYAVFFIYEKKHPEPLLDVNILTKNKVFMLANLSSLMNYMAASAVLFLVSLQLRISFGYETTHIGLVLLAQSLAMTITAPLAGRFSDRHENSFISSAGMGLIAVMMFLMSATADINNPFMLAAIQFVIGVGFGMFAPANNKTIMNSVERKYYSTASSVLASMRLYGQTLSITLSVIVISLIAGDIKVEHLKPELLTRGFKAVFIVYGLISIVGIFTSAYGVKTKKAAENIS